MTTTTKLTVADIYKLLEEIPDPEIPVISIVELGVIREVVIEDDGKIIVKITPTYSGCPAMHAMERDIVHMMKHNHIDNYKIETIDSPAWTTDWLSDIAKEKLKNYGIAPPEKGASKRLLLFGKRGKIKCPRCNSTDTSIISEFGSTACKALYKCNVCREPFDYFKCI